MILAIDAPFPASDPARRAARRPRLPWQPGSRLPASRPAVRLTTRSIRPTRHQAPGLRRGLGRQLFLEGLEPLGPGRPELNGREPDLARSSEQDGGGLSPVAGEFAVPVRDGRERDADPSG